MQSLGKTLLIIGLLLSAFGVLLILACRFGVPFGRLPGDITYQKKNFTVFIPLGTMLVVSLIASLILNIFSRWK